MRDRVSEMDKTSPKEEGKAYFKRSSFGSFVGSKGEVVPSSYVDKETGYLSLAYDRISVIALEAIDTLYEEYKQLKERVNELEKLLHSKEIL